MEILIIFQLSLNQDLKSKLHSRFISLQLKLLVKLSTFLAHFQSSIDQIILSLIQQVRTPLYPIYVFLMHSVYDQEADIFFLLEFLIFVILLAYYFVMRSKKDCLFLISIFISSIGLVLVIPCSKSLISKSLFCHSY